MDELSRDRARMVAILAQHGRRRAGRRRAPASCSTSTRPRAGCCGSRATPLGRPYVEAIRHPGIVEQFDTRAGRRAGPGLELAVSRDGARDAGRPRGAGGRRPAAARCSCCTTSPICKRADQIRRDFVANVSHELRTPLTAIKGYAEALLDEPDDAEARQRFLEIIHRHATRMERLVKDLLRLARLDAGQELLERVPTDVAGAASRRRRRLRADASAEKQTAACRSTAAETPLLVASTRAKLHDIVRNLVENAVNYTPDGGTVARQRRRAPTSALTVDGDRQRAGHPVRGSRPRLRALLSRRQVARPARRHRARPGDREAPRRPARRQRQRRQPCRAAAPASRCDCRSASAAASACILTLSGSSKAASR